MKKRIGSYQLDRQLDSAANSTVYLAFDRETGRNVVLEKIPVSGADEADLQQHLETGRQKAERAVGLRHSRIAQVYGVVVEDGLWVAREPVKGETLENLLCTDSGISQELISRVLHHTASCLDYAHQLGVFHGSLSPAELTVQEDGSLKILGFWKPSLASSGEVSPFDRTHYASPEQIRGLEEQAASDQYSLATIAHELLTGVTPFRGDAIAVRNRIMLDTPPNPAEANPSLGEAAAGVLLRALEKVPSARFESCVEFVGELNDALEATPAWVLPEEYHGHTVSLSSAEAPRQLEGEVTEALLREVLAEPPTPVRKPRRFNFDLDLDFDLGRYIRAGAIGAVVIAMVVALWGWYSSPSTEATSEDLSVAEVAPPPVVVNQPYVFSLQARGGRGPYEWSVVDGHLPDGLSLDAEGVIRGQSGEAGVYDVRVQVKGSDASEAVTKELSLTVKQGPRIKAANTLTDAVLGREYSHPLGVEGGQRPYRWTITSGSVPPGMSLNSFSGFLGGRPESAGTYRFSVSVSDLFGATSTREFELTVRPASSGTAERIVHANAASTVSPGSGGGGASGAR